MYLTNDHTQRRADLTGDADEKNTKKNSKMRFPLTVLDVNKIVGK